MNNQDEVLSMSDAITLLEIFVGEFGFKLSAPIERKIE